MEWAELLPDQQRDLKALLGLDDNGLPLPPLPPLLLSTSAAVDGDHRPPEVPSQHVAPVATTVTPSQLKAAIADQVSLVYHHWLAVRKLRVVHNNRTPELISCSVTAVRHILDGIVFKEFMVVYAAVDVEIGFRDVKTAKRGRSAKASGGAKRGRDGDALKAQWLATEKLTFHTMHFGHRTMADVGYEVQSVSIPNAPLELQCVAGNILQFTLLTFLRIQCGAPDTSIKEGGWDVAKMSLPVSGDVVILGMGGNVMGNCLVHLLPPTIAIHVVEIEPSVVAVCQLEQLIPTTSNFHVHICDVVVALRDMQDASCSIIILDCFDPLVGEMESGHGLLALAKSKLLRPQPIDCAGQASQSPGGLLIVNVHRRPQQDALQVFFDVFGAQCVEAIDLPGAPQCFVACTLSPIPKLTAKQLTTFSEIAAAFLKSTTGFECPVPLGAKSARDVVSANTTDHDAASRTFRVWVGMNDV